MLLVRGHQVEPLGDDPSTVDEAEKAAGVVSSG